MFNMLVLLITKISLVMLSVQLIIALLLTRLLLKRSEQFHFQTLHLVSFDLAACHQQAFRSVCVFSHYTLMISTSWSTPLSPGKMGWPRSSSASTQPADQMSMLDV